MGIALRAALIIYMGLLYYCLLLLSCLENTHLFFQLYHFLNDYLDTLTNIKSIWEYSMRKSTNCVFIFNSLNSYSCQYILPIIYNILVIKFISQLFYLITFLKDLTFHFNRTSNSYTYLGVLGQSFCFLQLIRLVILMGILSYLNYFIFILPWIKVWILKVWIFKPSFIVIIFPYFLGYSN